jgi:CheY-like chemotaxis protein
MFITVDMTHLSEASSSPAAQSNLVALVADDFPATRSNLVSGIQTYDPGAEIIEVTDGNAAVAALGASVPNIAFVNVQLPKLSGAEALAFSRAQGIKPFTILLSNIVVPEWAELSLRLGAYEFLKKPFDPDHVTHLLRAYDRTRTPIKLLLVDASQASREMVRRILLSSGFSFEIDETDTGQHALKVLRTSHYDLAMIERNLPVGIDGLETACQASQISPGTKLILMSSADTGPLEQVAGHFGVVALLKKPFYSRDVDYTIHQALGLRRPYLLNALVPLGVPLIRRAVGF